MPAKAGSQELEASLLQRLDSRLRVCRFSCHEFCSVAIVALAHRRVIKSLSRNKPTKGAGASIRSPLGGLRPTQPEALSLR